VEDLAPLDQWHVMGNVPKRRLAEKAGIKAEDYVLDAGAGIGGPARLLAASYGCRVEGVDVTDPYLETAVMLTELTKLGDLVSFRHADVTDLPFSNQTFDVVWTSMRRRAFPIRNGFSVSCIEC
jgi:MPBQ/MSBQ methyltransferase